MLVFYPKDFTPVCTRQLNDYSKSLERFNHLGILPVGINIDSSDLHCSFSEQNNFTFSILSDKSKKVSRLYDALNILGRNKRKIVIIDKYAKIVYEHSILPIFYESSTKILQNKVFKKLSAR